MATKAKSMKTSKTTRRKPAVAARKPVTVAKNARRKPAAAAPKPATKTTRRKRIAAAPKVVAGKKPVARRPHIKVTGSAAAGRTRAGATPREGLNGPDPVLMKKQSGIWNLLMDYYFRLEIKGWEKLPKEPALLIGVHSGGPLTMDAWTVALAWWRHFEGKRTLHGTAHDVLMQHKYLGRYFRRMGTISPSRESIQAAFKQGDDVILWPGGEVDAYRKWTKRDQAVLGGRKGFIKLAIRSGVPIVPVATVGGHDTLFVLSEGRGLAKLLNLKEKMRVDVAPITLSLPFGVALHLMPFQHIPLPSKIRTELLEPVYLDTDPARADDEEYVDAMYADIESRIQAGMTRLAKKRRFPILG